MTNMRDFVREYRYFIDKYIEERNPKVGKITDEVREDWVRNSEELYEFAKRLGVKP